MLLTLNIISPNLKLTDYIEQENLTTLCSRKKKLNLVICWLPDEAPKAEHISLELICNNVVKK